jgi:hypothetical protein
MDQCPISRLNTPFMTEARWNRKSHFAR